ncbi:MAG: OB-fold nucleic acid binding domain-containing protein [Candidatus Woesearchaeota archaeon]
MKVNELQARAAVDEIILKVDSIDEPRQVRNGALTVANATVSDETGSVTLTLWNDEVNKVKTGDKIKITKGWVGEYQNQLQLSAGKFGQLEVLESAEKSQLDESIDEEII